MSWAKIDDRLHAHPKVRRLQRVPFAGAEAFGIWCWMLSWCRAYAAETGLVSLTLVACDWGAEDDHMADVFGLLVGVRLLDPVDGEPDGYRIHDWTDWQLDGHDHQVLAGRARAAAAERGPDGRLLPSRQDLLETSSPKQAEASHLPGQTKPNQTKPYHAMKSSSPTPAGETECPSCQRAVQVLKDGALRPHYREGDLYEAKWNLPQCAGQSEFKQKVVRPT